MNNEDDEKNGCLLTREDVIEEVVTEKLTKVPRDDMNVVLKDWPKIRRNYKKIFIDSFINYFAENPNYKLLFPSFSNVPEEDLPYNYCFRTHSFAVYKALNFLMSNWLGEYEEEDNKIIPVIGKTHFDRGITFEMMNLYKNSIVYSCNNHLKSSMKRKLSWQTVFDHIFDYYLGPIYPAPVPVEEED